MNAVVIEVNTIRAKVRVGASLVFRFSAMAALVVLVAMAVLGWYVFEGSRKHFTDTWLRTGNRWRVIAAQDYLKP